MNNDVMTNDVRELTDAELDTVEGAFGPEIAIFGVAVALAAAAAELIVEARQKGSSGSPMTNWSAARMPVHVGTWARGTCSCCRKSGVKAPRLARSTSRGARS